MSTRTGLVIFDCDGVLVDSEPIAMRVLVETVAAAGHAMEPEEAQARFLGRSLTSIAAMLREDCGVVLDAAALAQMRTRLYAAFRRELRAIPHIGATLEALAERQRAVCVASSSQPDRVELSLTLTGLWGHFAGRAFSAVEVARGKPAPDLFLHAAERMGYAPHETLVVEDSPAGVEAARRAEMAVLAFVGGSHAGGPTHRAALAAMGPDAVMGDMRELVSILDAKERE